MKATSVFCACLLLLGCTGLFGHDNRQGVSSSLVDFLYPSGEEPPKPPQTVPALELPIKVGLAFVPTRNGAGALTEAERIGLLNKVREHSRTRPVTAAAVAARQDSLRSRRLPCSRECDAECHKTAVQRR